MKYVDSSILVAAMRGGEAHHEACAELVISGEPLATSSHALMELFSILTGGGNSRPRVDADDAVQIIEENVVKRLQIVSLSPKEIIQTMKLCRERGVRGAAIYDFHHLACARKAGATVLHTLDQRDFQSFSREGDPEIRRPG